MIKILFVSSEAAPFVKTGGLGDVAGSLPISLHATGRADIRVIIPMYTSIDKDLLKDCKKIAEFTVPLSWRNQDCSVYQIMHKQVIFYFICSPYYFSRNAVYGEFDDAERYAFFSKAVLQCLPFIDFIPDVIHCNDWQSALIPVYKHAFYSHLYSGMKTVMTLHSMGYQGVFDKNIIGDVLGLEPSYYNERCLEHFGSVNLMKGGIYASDAVTTVSPTYAGEIQTPQYGCGLDGVILDNAYKLSGILNGISISEFNPWQDKYIAKRYSKNNLEGKRENKAALQKEAGFLVDENIPIIGMVTRLVDPKGLSLIIKILQDLLFENIQLIILGNGDRQYEEIFCQAANMHSQKMNVHIAFDNGYAHRIYAGADLFLMPSLFEPCGLSQMIAMRYGTLPIVRETGGLKDTVIPYNRFTGEGNGFSFHGYDAMDMKTVIWSALSLYHEGKQAWQGLIQNAMHCDFSWKASAEKYIALYQSLISPF